jgi:hypothetical protein
LVARPARSSLPSAKMNAGANVPSDFFRALQAAITSNQYKQGADCVVDTLRAQFITSKSMFLASATTSTQQSLVSDTACSCNTHLFGSAKTVLCTPPRLVYP